MRHVERTTQRVTDGMADAHRQAGNDGDHRAPGAFLAHLPGGEVAVVGLDRGEPLRQEPEAVHRQAIPVVVRIEGAEGLKAMVERAHARREPDPFRRVHGDGRIEHDRTRRHRRVEVGLLDVDLLVRRARQRIEFTTRQRRRHDHHRNVGAREGRHRDRPVRIDDHVVRLHRLRRAQAVFQAHGEDLGQVGDRAAAERDQEVRLQWFGDRDRGADVLARHVRTDTVEDADEPITERLFDFPHFVGLVPVRVAADQEHALRALQVHFLGECLGTGASAVHTLERSQSDRRLVHGSPDCRVHSVCAGRATHDCTGYTNRVQILTVRKEHRMPV